jgi:hypothetical protein
MEKVCLGRVSLMGGWRERDGGNLLADERAVVLVDDGVEEALGVPVGADGVPKPRSHDVDSVFLLHPVVVQQSRTR